MDKTQKPKRKTIKYNPVGLIEWLVKFRCLRLQRRHGNQYKTKD